MCLWVFWIVFEQQYFFLKIFENVLSFFEDIKEAIRN